MVLYLHLDIKMLSQNGLVVNKAAMLLLKQETVSLVFNPAGDATFLVKRKDPMATLVLSKNKTG